MTSTQEEMIDRINISLTDVPKDLHRAWKAIAAWEGLTMKQAVVEALRFWITAKAKEGVGTPEPIEEGK